MDTTSSFVAIDLLLAANAFFVAGMSDQVLHTSAFVTGFLIFSSLHIVVGEQAPKTFATRQAETVSIWVSYPLHFAYLLVWPLNYLLNKASGSILSWFGVQEATHAEVLSGEEIRGLVATSKAHGEIHHKQAEMLNNLFEFDQRQVGRVMIPRTRIHALDVSAEPQISLAVIRDTEHSRFPVIDSAQDDRIIGILLAKDIHRPLLAGQAEPWKDLAALCRTPTVVPETQQVAKLFEQMRNKRAHMAFVIGEYGAFVGIVTLEDLLEEIVGEIHDETDEDDEQPALIATGEQEWEAARLVSLTDLQKTIGLTVPVDLDANTLSGLVMTRLGRVPRIGDELTEADFHLQVLDVEEHRVGRAMITRIRTAQPGNDGTKGVDPAVPTQSDE